jgi:hypothetical protein
MIAEKANLVKLIRKSLDTLEVDLSQWLPNVKPIPLKDLVDNYEEILEFRKQLHLYRESEIYLKLDELLDLDIFQANLRVKSV